jgi:hypothetical protein
MTQIGRGGDTALFRDGWRSAWWVLRGYPNRQPRTSEVDVWCGQPGK